MDPSRSRSRRSSPALVMLPLCATAICPLLQATEKRLRVEQHRVAGRGIARVADGQIAGQTGDLFRRKDIRHMAHGLEAADLATVAGGDARALLAAMLQRVQAQIRQVGRFGMAVNSKHATLLVEFIVGKLVELEVVHDWCSMRSSEVSQGLLQLAQVAIQQGFRTAIDS